MNFELALKNTFLTCLDNDYQDNYDFYMHGEEKPQDWPKMWRKDFKWKIPFITKRKLTKKFLANKAARFEFLYDSLATEQEKDVLLKLIVFRELGHRRVKLPASADYFETMKEITKDFDENRGAKCNLPFIADLYLTDFSKYGFPFQMYSGPLGIYYEVIADQYQFVEANFQINEGDYIIDAGACIGDSSFFFAHSTGPKGKVFAFEMLPENLKILRENLDINKETIKNITVIEKPVSETSGQELFIVEHGPASRVVESRENAPDNCIVAKSISIDDFVEQNSIDKIDMIKMDIEGAELSALKGAVKTIKRFKPKLAICVYHKETDFEELPKFIESLDMGYSFHLKHNGIQLGETVMYCK